MVLRQAAREHLELPRLELENDCPWYPRLFTQRGTELFCQVPDHGFGFCQQDIFLKSVFNRYGCVGPSGTKSRYRGQVRTGARRNVQTHVQGLAQSGLRNSPTVLIPSFANFSSLIFPLRQAGLSGHLCNRPDRGGSDRSRLQPRTLGKASLDRLFNAENDADT